MLFAAFFIFANLALLIPGFAFLSLSKIKDSLILPLSYALNIAFFALLSTFHYLLNVPTGIIQAVFWIYFFSGLVILVKNSYYKRLLKFKFILGSLILMSVVSLSVISLSFTSKQNYIPDPEVLSNRNYSAYSVKVLNVAQTNANDNSVPYRQAQFFTNRSDPSKDSFIDEWGVHFFQRTPLMGAVSGTFFIALNDNLPIGYIWSSFSSDPHKTYQKFQILAHILNSIIIIPAFFLISKLFNRNVAKLSILLMISSPFFIYNSFFTWPKTFVAFFILLSLLLLYEKKIPYTILAGVFGGMAYLAHDLAVLYIVPIVALLLLWKRLRDILLFGITFSLFVLPWVIISAIIYKKPSSFILYPLSIHGIPQPALREKIIQEFFDTPVIQLIKIRLESIYYLLSPYQLIYSEGGQAVGRRLWAFNLFSIPGALGIGTIIPTILGLLKHIKKWDVYIMIFVPIVLSTIVIGWPKGLGALHFAQASVVLLLALASSWILSCKYRLVLLMVLIFNYLQLLFFIIYSFGSSYQRWDNARDITLLIVINLVFLATGLYSLRLVKSELKHKIIQRPKKT